MVSFSGSISAVVSFAFLLATLSLTTTTHAFSTPAKTTARVLHPPLSMSSPTSDVDKTSDPSTNDLPRIPFLTKTYDSDWKSVPVSGNPSIVGEDAGAFDIQTEEWGELGEIGWFTFSAAVATILTAVAILWIYPATGYADDFLHLFSHLNC